MKGGEIMSENALFVVLVSELGSLFCLFFSGFNNLKNLQSQ